MKKIDEILRDNQSGSLTIAQHALNHYRKMIQNLASKDPEQVYKELQIASKKLMKSQSNMVVLRKASNNLLITFKRVLKSEKNNQEIISDLLKKIDQIEEEINSKAEKIIHLGSRIIANSNKIMTISNSTLVKRIFKTANDQRRKFEVFCLKSHPPNEGITLAEELVGMGIKTTLIPDSAMGMFVAQMNLILLGADRLFEDGFINKIGTLPLCLTAKLYNVPIYLAVETSKILLESERAIKFTAQKQEEVYQGRPKNLNIENFYFEKIPLNLIHKLICEDGVFETFEFINWYLKE